MREILVLEERPGGTGARLSGSRCWLVYLALGVLAVVVDFLLPAPLEGAILPLVTASAAAMMVVGVRTNDPINPAVWYFLASGLLMFSAADALAFVYEKVLGIDPFPSIADAFYLVGYPLLTAGLLLLIRGRASGSDKASLVDALIITTGLGLLLWIFIMSPYAQDPELSLLERTTSLAYPLADVLLLGAVMRLVVAPGARTATYRFLVFGLLALLVTDVVYAELELAGIYHVGGTSDIGWMVAYLSLGLAALHPSMRDLSEPVPRTGTKPTKRRLALLAGASLMAPTVLVVQAVRGEPIAVPAIAGASIVLFLLVLVRMENLVSALETTLRDREVLEEQLKHQALHDPLTNLANRVLFTDRVGHALSRKDRCDGPLAVIFVDLDDFKSVNDSLGHEAGDKLLVATAQRIRKCLRPMDTAARLGGDEFAILLEDLSDRGVAVRIAERLLKVLGEPLTIGSKRIPVHASVGIAVSHTKQEETDELLRNADAAMYRAKSRGKGVYAVFEPGMRAEALGRLELKADLEQAVDQGQFVVHYQPIFVLETGEIREVEALVRWQHPERGLVPPLEFIPLAEETGLIVPVGLWVLREACHQVKAWQTESPSEPKLTLSVNLSARQFQQPGLVQDIVEALQDTGLDPRNLKLEITESVAMEDVEATASKLGELEDLGIQVALDDFGTGYSTLNYLKSFSVDTLKIDRSFVAGLGHDHEATAIVGAVIALAKSLDLSVTAEGVETADQLSRLQDLGCDRSQGFYFARPLEENAMAALLEARANKPARRT